MAPYKARSTRRRRLTPEACVPGDLRAAAAHLLALRREGERACRAAPRHPPAQPHAVLRLVDAPGVAPVEAEAAVPVEAEVEEVGGRRPLRAVGAGHAVANPHAGDIAAVTGDVQLHAQALGGPARIASAAHRERAERRRRECEPEERGEEYG